MVTSAPPFENTKKLPIPPKPHDKICDCSFCDIRHPSSPKKNGMRHKSVKISQNQVAERLLAPA
jgi:hypothetical protein